MPTQTQEAVNWALQQTVTNAWGFTIQVTKDTPSLLVDKVREYFNANGIEYDAFSYDDLKPYVN